ASPGERSPGPRGSSGNKPRTVRKDTAGYSARAACCRPTRKDSQRFKTDSSTTAFVPVAGKAESVRSSSLVRFSGNGPAGLEDGGGFLILNDSGKKKKSGDSL